MVPQYIPMYHLCVSEEVLLNGFLKVVKLSHFSLQSLLLYAQLPNYDHIQLENDTYLLLRSDGVLLLARVLPVWHNRQPVQVQDCGAYPGIRISCSSCSGGLDSGPFHLAVCPPNRQQDVWMAVQGQPACLCRHPLLIPSLQSHTHTHIHTSIQ